MHKLHYANIYNMIKLYKTGTILQKKKCIFRWCFRNYSLELICCTPKFFMVKFKKTGKENRKGKWLTMFIVGL